MAGSSGLAGLAVTGLVSALVAFGVSAALRGSDAAPPAPAPLPGGLPREESERLRREIASLRRRVDEVRPEGAAGAAPSAPAAPSPGASAPAPGAAPPAGPPGPLPATREELLSLIDERIRGSGAVPGAAPAVPPRKKVTLDQAGEELGLTSLEVDALKRTWKAAEEEALAAVMGTTDIAAVKEEVRLAKDDPDRKAALVNKAVANAIRNLGSLMTIEDRRDRELRKFLPEETVKKLRGYDVQSTVGDPELEAILHDVFDR